MNIVIPRIIGETTSLVFTPENSRTVLVSVDFTKLMYTLVQDERSINCTRIYFCPPFEVDSTDEYWLIATPILPLTIAINHPEKLEYVKPDNEDRNPDQSGKEFLGE